MKIFKSKLQLKKVTATKRMKKITKKVILKQLKNVVDPELGVDIVSLGLVYDVISSKPKSSPSSCLVKVIMTLTSPGCPLAPIIHEQVENALMELKGVDDVEVEIVWDPPWNMEMASKETKLLLGW
ncbi:MAG: methyltransferase protein [Microgenomates group bacterium GW2011_GWA2_44_7]|nr:MAG: methyltransferase protein [Microgenomates group bacterium GW2011_GWA2_44_7]KKT77834.1 MAG: methyltransferase protein [Microgenomates group bacterium GW2011_GWB1_44_8]